MKKLVPFIFVALVVVGVYYAFFHDLETQYSTDNQSLNNINEQAEKFEISDEKINNILLTEFPSQVLKTDRGKVFCSTKKYGSEYDTESKTINVYIWAYCEEYYLVDTDVLGGNLYNKPAVVKITAQDEAVKISDIEIISNFEDRSIWVKQHFPNQYSSIIDYENDSKNLNPSPETQAQNYFKGILEAYF